MHFQYFHHLFRSESSITEKNRFWTFLTFFPIFFFFRAVLCVFQDQYFRLQNPTTLFISQDEVAIHVLLLFVTESLLPIALRYSFRSVLECKISLLSYWYFQRLPLASLSKVQTLAWFLDVFDSSSSVYVATKILFLSSSLEECEGTRSGDIFMLLVHSLVIGAIESRSITYHLLNFFFLLPKDLKLDFTAMCWWYCSLALEDCYSVNCTRASIISKKKLNSIQEWVLLDKS